MPAFCKNPVRKILMTICKNIVKVIFKNKTAFSQIHTSIRHKEKDFMGNSSLMLKNKGSVSRYDKAKASAIVQVYLFYKFLYDFTWLSIKLGINL